jgi:hypothetical protein
MDNLAGLDFIPAGAIIGEKRKLRRKHPQGNKTRAGRVYPNEHVHTRRGLAPLSLQVRAILPPDGQNVKGMRPRTEIRQERNDDGQEEG